MRPPTAARCEPARRRAADRRAGLPRRGILPEYESKAYLAALGIAVPQGALARDAGAAREIAARIGYPVALKAQAAALAHKSDAGGVVADIADDGGARRGVAARHAQASPRATRIWRSTACWSRRWCRAASS